jgi:hypothetical protein
LNSRYLPFRSSDIVRAKEGTTRAQALRELFYNTKNPA